SGPESREGGGAGVVPLPQRRGPRRT
ncbi:DUF3000 domain-containing protein, partial [Streptomyces somaliensis DSM 40738]|nr:DUF3000 domain-containing protein [Streptomyces somaliensis DSM 40738]